MNNQPTPDLSSVIDALEKADFRPRINGIEFVKGKQTIIITPMGFVWKQGRQVVPDLTFNEILQKIK